MNELKFIADFNVFRPSALIGGAAVEIQHAIEFGSSIAGWMSRRLTNSQSVIWRCEDRIWARHLDTLARFHFCH